MQSRTTVRMGEQQQVLTLESTIEAIIISSRSLVEVTGFNRRIAASVIVLAPVLRINAVFK